MRPGTGILFTLPKRFAKDQLAHIRQYALPGL